MHILYRPLSPLAVVLLRFLHMGHFVGARGVLGVLDCYCYVSLGGKRRPGAGLVALGGGNGNDQTGVIHILIFCQRSMDLINNT